MSGQAAKRPEVPRLPEWRAIWPHIEALDEERARAKAEGRPVFRFPDRFELTDKGREVTPA